ncbi:hypothetical protein [Actomonas aquatica]|uniref:YtkA-like domain-containing protein n=1 Tax=Actomonas aquatica TaxID=2866162 RepID=A0ABZ1CCP1_9BACT|nr:hypothetical protein [Opitutus sp. WL0086]WRQ89443.1 hypothetical protein K1X11_008480 [Opitutus sp. WL0086]
MSETATAPSFNPAQRRQMVVLTLGALAIFAVFRWLPTGTNLSHGDFRLEGENVLEFCDPAAPQFLPVTTARSPVSLTLAPTTAAVGQPLDLTLTLATSTGKAIGPVDLLVAHTRKLHLMAVDPTLRDYHHLHPEPGETPGEWHVSFTPKLAGTYRVFADFTPAATARGLYASADIEVPGEVAQNPVILNPTAERDGFAFSLRTDGEQVRAREPADLTLAIRALDGSPVQLGEVMGAFAHLVAFDRERSGFAHLHPRETDLVNPPDALAPELHFQVTIPEAGLYVIWAQMVLNDTETFVPFWFEVEP